MRIKCYQLNSVFLTDMLRSRQLVFPDQQQLTRWPHWYSCPTCFRKPISSSRVLLLSYLPDEVDVSSLLLHSHTVMLIHTCLQLWRGLHTLGHSQAADKVAQNNWVSVGLGHFWIYFAVSLSLLTLCSSQNSSPSTEWPLGQYPMTRTHMQVYERSHSPWCATFPVKASAPFHSVDPWTPSPATGLCCRPLVLVGSSQSISSPFDLKSVSFIVCFYTNVWLIYIHQKKPRSHFGGSFTSRVRVNRSSICSTNKT